jgi:hypothetical protein
MSNLLDKVLFTDVDPNTTTFLDVALGQNAEASRHQIHLTTKPDASTGTITIKGIGRGAAAGKALLPAVFDTRFRSINMADGSKIFVFYGLFSGLRFDFAGFAAGKKVSAVLVSQTGDLLISGNGP